MGMTTSENSDSIDCPHCGKPNKDLWEHELEDDGEVLFSCAHCGQTVKLSAKVTYDYTAEALPPTATVEDNLEQATDRLARARVRYRRLVELHAPQLILDNEQALIDKWAARVRALGGTPIPRDCTQCPHSRATGVTFRYCTHPAVPAAEQVQAAQANPVTETAAWSGWPLAYHETRPRPGCPLEKT